GCLLIVSHDRYFMDRLVDHLFVFEGDGVIYDFPGNYTQYRLQQKEGEKGKGEKSAPPAAAQDQPGATATPKEKKKLSYKEQREFEQLEKEIPQLEQEKETVTAAMSQPDLPFDELQKL